MTLAIKDGNGAAKNLRTTEVSAEQVTHHILVDTAGNTVDVHSGALNIHHVDVHDKAIIEDAYMTTGVSTTLSAATVVNNTTIDVVSATGLTVGSIIQAGGGLATITNIATNTLTLDNPISKVVSSGTVVNEVVINMAVVGSLASPKIFKVTPLAGEVWHITRLILIMTHAVAGDLSKFGGIPAITNGMLMRTYKAGAYIKYTNWKTNSEIKKTMYDLDFTDKAKTTGDVYGTSGRFTLSRLGVAIKLDGDAGDYLEIRIQDDVSALGTIELTAEGHVA